MTKTNKALLFLNNAGSAAPHLQAHDWQATPLGLVESWPENLITVLGPVFESKLPKLLCWGTQLTCVYNAAFYQEMVCGNQIPDVLGLPFAMAFPALKNEMDVAVKKFNTDAGAAQQITIPAKRNRLVGAYYLCAPVYGEGAGLQGMLLTLCLPDRKVLRQAQNSLSFQQLVRAAPVAILMLTGPDYRILMVNSTFLEITGNREDALIRKPLFDAYPLIEQRFSPILQNILHTGESYYGEELAIPISFDGKPKLFYLNIILQPVDVIDNQTQNIMAIIIDVTKSSEEKKFLKEKEERFKKMIKGSRVCILLLNGRNHTIEYGNDLAFSRILHADAKTSIGKPLFELLPELQRTTPFNKLDLVLTSGRHLSEKEIKIPGNGSTGEEERYCDFDLLPVTNDSGAITGIMISIYDVTENVISRLLQKEGQQRLQMSLDDGGLALWEIELPSQTITYTSRLGEIFGANHETGISEMLQYIHPDERDEIRAVFRAALQTGKYFFEGRFVRPDGVTGWIRIRGKVFYNEEGEAIKMIGSTRDISEEKKKQIDLQRRESRLRHLILEAPIAIAILRGPDYRVEIINDVAVQLLGKTKKQLEGHPVLEVMSEVDIHVAKSLLDQVYYHDRTISGEEYPVKLLRNGRMEKVYVQFEYDPLRNSQGKRSESWSWALM